MLLAGLVVGLLAVAPAGASAADRFASPTGTDMDDCTEADPCSLVQAVNMSANGDDITILPGSYSTSTTLLPMAGGFNRTIHGAPGGGRPTINFTAPGPGTNGWVLGPGSTIRDVVLESTAGQGGSALFVGAGGTIERVSVHETGIDTRACSFNPDTVIRDSVCWYTGVDGSNATAVLAQGGSGTSTMRNVTAVATNGHGIRVHAFGSGDTFGLNGTNVIAKGGGVPGQEDVLTTSFSGAVSATATLDHSNYATEFETLPVDTITDPGSGTNQLTPPVFANEAGGDFHQLVTSTGTLSKGTATGLLPGELDFEGDLRNQGTAVDIGADEFIAGPAPAAPALTGITPPSGSNNNSPTITGTAPPLTTIDLYPNATCTPPAAIAGATAADLLSPGLTVTVPNNSTTTFSATASDAVVTSACSTTNVTYSEVTPVPAAPVLTGISPPSGSNNNSPTITGMADPLTTIDLYANATCTPPAAITGAAAADLMSPGLTVSVPDNSTTTFSATASNEVGPSACSTTNVTYSEVTPPPPATAGPTGQRAAALKKCKKKKTKEKRKKCKKKANKLPV